MVACYGRIFSLIKARKIEESHSKRAVRATMWAAVNTLIPMITSFSVLVVTSRMLRPGDFGVVALASGLALLGSSLCPGGFGEANVQRLDLTARHLNAVFWLCMGCGCFVYLMECEFARFAARFFKIEVIAILIPVLGLKLISDMAAVVPNALIARSMSFYLFAIRSLIASLVAATITIVLLFKGYGFWALVASQLTTSFITAIAASLSAGWRPQFSFSLHALKEISGYGAFSSATMNVSNCVSQGEQILVGYVLGTTQLGLYNFSKRVIAVLNGVVSGSLGSVAHPMFSGMQNDRERVGRVGKALLSLFKSNVLSGYCRALDHCKAALSIVRERRIGGSTINSWQMYRPSFSSPFSRILASKRRLMKSSSSTIMIWPISPACSGPARIRRPLSNLTAS
jgi:O-antigen/teichoic acid export membrane protein